MAVSGSIDQTLIVWDLESYSELTALRGHSGRVSCCASFAGGAQAISGDQAGSVKVWR